MTEASATTAAPSATLPLDLGTIAGELRAGRASPSWMQSWLPATWHAPARFARALYAQGYARAQAPIRSRPEVGLDFYADCILEKLGSNRAALVGVQAGRTREASYEWLHARCSALASAWRNAGVTPGASLAIVLPVGVDYAIALLTGLRLGLCVSVLPPLGPAYVRNRLARLAPDHVVTTDLHLQLLAPGSPTPLSPHASGGDATLASSHAYAADDIALRLFSPFGDPEREPFELAAGALHAALLRDGLLTFALQPGDRIAAPGFDPVQWQPLGMMCAWFAGAAFVELELSELVTTPGLLQRLGVTVLGIDHALRELVLARGPELVFGARSWFRSLSDVFDYVRWEQLERMLCARQQLGFTVLFNAASYGSHLFSAPTGTIEPARIWPAAGRDFMIGQTGAGLLPAIDGTGVYTPLCDGEPDESLVRMVVAKLEHGWTLGGSIDPGPQARALPVREIAASARKHEKVREACVVVTPGRFTNDGHSVLVAFVADPDPGGGASLPTTEITRLIARDLGVINSPERIDAFALHARYINGELDRDWCSSQYLSGTLSQKARVPLFSTLSRLAWIFEAAEPAEP